MPLYFFHRTDSVFDPDQEGTEMPDLEAARLEAIRFAGATARDRPHRVLDGGNLRIEVSDEAGMLLCTVMVLATDAPAARGWTGRPGRSEGQR